MMKRTVLAVVSCAFLAVPVIADPFPTVRLEQTRITPGLKLEIHSTGYDGATWAGVCNLNVENPGYGPIVGEIEGFCIDLWDISPDTYAEYEVKPLSAAPDPGAAPEGGMGLVKARRLAQLLDTYWTSDIDSNIEGTALQIAVWEIVDEPLPADPGNYDVRSGTFSASQAWYNADPSDEVRALANEWLRALNANGGDFGNYLALSCHGTEDPSVFQELGLYQDYVVRVPVPPAVLLGILGLGAAGTRLRKRI